jgi:hypothetical protein
MFLVCEIPGWRATRAGRVREKGARLAGGQRVSVIGQGTKVSDGPSRAYNGLEMSRLAVPGDAPSAEASFPGSAPWAQDQLQGKDTPVARRESISGSWQRDPAGQVGSIELLDAQDPLLRAGNPRLAGDVRRKGSGAKGAPRWRATPFRFEARVIPFLTGLRGRTTASR